MPMDMYCTFEGLPGESEPVHLVILAWSHGLVKNPQKETSEPHPSTWDVKAVGEWLKRSNLEEFVKVFEEQDISGKELFSVTREDLNDMKITKVGHKIRLENAIDDLRAKYPDPPAEQKNRRGQNIQDLSMTCYMDDRCYKLLFHLLQGSVIPKATLFCYQSSRPGYGRHRGGGSDDEDDSDLVAPKARDLLSAVILKNAQVTSLSTGGSGGEDRFTANLTLTSHQMSFIGQMYPSVEAKTYAKYNSQPHGVVVEYEAGKAKAYIKEWGVQAGWSKHSHISFPQEFKNTVWTLLLIHNTKKNALFGQLPAECLHNIFLQLSHHYMPTNPFEGVEYPGYISTKKSKDEE